MMSVSSPESLTLLALFALGLAGSGHCVGMCGPLVIAFAGQSGRGAHLAYHLGRLLTYAGMGALAGGLADGLGSTMAGGSFVWTARIHGAVAALSALLLAWMGLAKLGLVAEPRWMSLANPSRLPGFRYLQGRLVARRDRATDWRALAALAALGLLLGLLPCGLSYAAFARALSAGSAARGAALTSAFGLGTLPSLLAVGWTASRLGSRYQRHSELAGGMLMIGMAAALLLGTRGVQF